MLRTAPFTGDYPSVPAFIYGITREIWEERGIGAKIAKYYAPQCIVRAATGVTTDNAGVTAQTLQTLHQFPDRQLVGEDVIWHDDSDGGFLSSHRLISVMRHLGDGSYGQASGRLVRSRIIADCRVENGVVTEEWLVRDQAAFARCLGMTAQTLAERMVAHDLATTGTVGYFTPAGDVAGRYRAPYQHDDADVRGYVDSWERIWGAKDLAGVRDLYTDGALLAVPGGDYLSGHGEIDRFCLSYLASFPDGVFQIESAFVNREPGQPLRLTMRWSLTGTHAGFGHFGAPTGAPVYVMGMNHAHLAGGRVTQEWVVTDEVSIWKQIFAHVGQQAEAGAVQQGEAGEAV
jgi:ketosteroid isomerase-like protein